MVEIRQERVADIWREIAKIAEEHWKETEAYRHGQGFNPNWDQYFRYEEMGLYHQFTARHDGKLVGYGGFYVMPSMHTQRLIGSEDTYFVLPEYRRGRTALNLFKAMENRAKALGAVELTVTTKVSNPKAELIVQYMGYRVVEHRWSKPLNQEQRHVQPRNSASA